MLHHIKRTCVDTRISQREENRALVYQTAPGYSVFELGDRKNSVLFFKNNIDTGMNKFLHETD